MIFYSLPRNTDGRITGDMKDKNGWPKRLGKLRNALLLRLSMMRKIGLRVNAYKSPG